MSKSLQVFEHLAIYCRGGTRVLGNVRIANTTLATLTLASSKDAAFVPGQFVRLAVVSGKKHRRALGSLLSPSHPYTIASAPCGGVVKIMYSAEAAFGKELLKVGDGDHTLICRGYFGPTDRCVRAPRFAVRRFAKPSNHTTFAGTPRSCRTLSHPPATRGRSSWPAASASPRKCALVQAKRAQRRRVLLRPCSGLRAKRAQRRHHSAEETGSLSEREEGANGGNSANAKKAGSSEAFTLLLTGAKEGGFFCGLQFLVRRSPLRPKLCTRPLMCACGADSSLALAGTCPSCSSSSSTTPPPASTTCTLCSCAAAAASSSTWRRT